MEFSTYSNMEFPDNTKGQTSCNQKELGTLLILSFLSLLKVYHILRKLNMMSTYEKKMEVRTEKATEPLGNITK